MLAMLTKTKEVERVEVQTLRKEDQEEKIEAKMAEKPKEDSIKDQEEEF